MSKPANKTVIGIFVVVALVLVVGAVLILGSGKFFKNYPKFVMYFQGSVKGLAVGAPVNFRGVKIGTVTNIKMLLNPKDLSMIIPVYIEIEPDTIQTMEGSPSLETIVKESGKAQLMPDMIKRGLRAQLEMQSIVTGPTPYLARLLSGQAGRNCGYRQENRGDSHHPHAATGTGKKNRKHPHRGDLYQVE